MGPVALLTAILGVLAVALPGEGKYLALGLGIFAAGTGILAYRRPGTPSSRRLAGAAAVAVGLGAATLGGVKIALTLVALDRLTRLFGS